MCFVMLNFCLFLSSLGMLGADIFLFIKTKANTFTWVFLALGLGAKIVAVPPLALLPDLRHEVYLLDATVEDFKSAAAIELKEWTTQPA